MPVLLVVAGFFVPRFVLGLLWFFTDYMYLAFGGWLAPFLGFIFLPYATLVFTVLSMLGGSFSAFSWIAVFLAAALDLYQWSRRMDKKHKKWSRRFYRSMPPGSMVVEGKVY